MRISDWSSDVCSSDLGQPRKNREQSASAWFRTPTPCLWNDTIRIPLTSYALGPVDRSSKFVALFRLQSRRRCGHLRSEEHTSELQSLMRISYAVFCLKKKKEKQLPLYTT